MDLEPEQVEDERHHDQPKGSSGKVLAEVRQAQSSARSLDIQKIPQVDHDGRADGDEGEGTNILGGDVTRQSEPSQDEPFPPLSRERLVSELVELDVKEQAACHRENECSI